MPSLPPLQVCDRPERMPKQDPASYDAAQQAAAAALIASPRGEVRGPFVPLMRSPELMDRTQKLGEFLRYQCSVPERLREFAIIVAARIWSQAYEWHAHARLAHAAGVAAETIQALVDGELLQTAPEDERLVYDFCAALHLTRQVDDALYARAIALLGERGTIELVGLCGYYAYIAMVLNVACVPCPGTAFAVPAQDQPIVATTSSMPGN